MILILKNLPAGFNSGDLRSLVCRLINETAISSRQSIPKTEILVQFDRLKSEFEFYGLIYCNSRQHGQTTSRLFENLIYQGYVIEVAEYFQRQQSLWPETNQSVSNIVNRRRIPSEQLLTFKFIEEIEILPALEATQLKKNAISALSSKTRSPGSDC